MGSLAFYRFARSVVAGISYVVFRAKVRGRDHVPPAGAYVLTPTHRSYFDTPFTATVTRRRIHFMGKHELWSNRFGAWLFTSLGGFPVDRGAGTGALKAALDVLTTGEPVVVFPEGTRRTGDLVTDLHEGAAFLAVKAGVPLVPIGIAGSERILARDRKLPRFSPVAVVVGRPIWPDRREGERPRAEVRRLTADLNVELQRLFDEAGDIL